ncbi:23S rRNA (guanosine(2251)-2'-O)-methyltransferase RlmB [Lacibacter sp. H407]|uniref:23S rRNA (guanosine(2251)-2'-O)-methyltransferase RlmB n=1 Tax=Lacibacter sp. H407 TaxID=3133423 RepID=UPI0030BF26FD
MKQFRQKQQRPKKSSLVVGRIPILEALQEGKQLDRIYMQNNQHGDVAEEILKLAFKQQVPVNKVPVEKLNSFNVGDHQGFIAQLSKIRYQDLQQVIDWVVEKGDVPMFVILDGVTDIRNIGGIARTALCCGAQALIIPDKGVGALNEDAILASAGALELIAVCRVNSLMKAVDDLHLNGIRVFASEMTAAKNIYDCDFKEPCAIVMGGEEKGVFPGLMKICDETFKIPMKGDFESLNVGIATAMILYEAMKQRG